MKKVSYFLGFTGIALVGAAFFAEFIGWDNDPGWGPGRILILRLGLLILMVSFLGLIFNNPLSSLYRRVAGFISKFNTLGQFTQIITISFITTVTVIGIYTWYEWPNFFQSGTRYYSDLAISYKNGRLDLLEEPSEGLISMEDPYDYYLRKKSGIEDFPWDASLYKGKFYLYWGPVPSLLLTPFDVDQLTRMEDEIPTFAFMCGLFIYLVVLIGHLWWKKNPSLPPWIFALSLLAAGLSSPSLWMLNYSRVYEAAIIGSQFFFIGGCFWAYSGLSDPISKPWKFILAGFHWAMAIGTRITILPSVFFLTFMVLLYLVKSAKSGGAGRYTSALLSLCGPLVIALVGVGWYNWARFDSVTEFGITYQLANVNYTKFRDSFSLAYISTNISSYFAHPVELQGKFPFMRAIEMITSNERFGGLLFISPFFLFAFISIARHLPKGLQSLGKGSLPPVDTWLLIALTGSALISLTTILCFYFPAMRYAGDFMPALMVLAAVSPPSELEPSKIRINRSVFFKIIYVLVVVYTVAAGSLIALQDLRVAQAVIMYKQSLRFLGLR